MSLAGPRSRASDDAGQALGQREHPGLQPARPARPSSPPPAAGRSIRTAAARACAPPWPRTIGLEPERLILGCGTDEIFALLNQTFLEPGDNIVQGEYGFGAYAIGARANQARGALRRRAQLPHRCRRHAGPGRRAHAPGLHRQSRPIPPAPSSPPRRWRACTRACRPACSWCSTAPMPSSTPTPPSPTAWIWRAAGENIVVTHTFSKMHGLAALRVGWAYAPAARGRRRWTASACRSTPPSPARPPPSPPWPTRNSRRVPWPWSRQWRPWLTQQLGGLGLEVDAVRRQLRADRLSRNARRAPPPRPRLSWRGAA